MKAQQSAGPNYAQYRQQIQNQQVNATRLQGIITYFQGLNPPQYLTSDIKFYVRKMIAREDSDETIKNYLLTLGSRLPIGRLVDGKVSKGPKQIPIRPPAGINPIARKK